jgi:GT2 family glycosyltransferase
MSAARPPPRAPARRHRARCTGNHGQPLHALSAPASIVIPTRARPEYLEVALASIAPQAAEAGAEVVVVDDAGASTAAARLAERFGARYVAHPRPLGLNHARNTGVASSQGELVVFVDDDVEVAPGWLDALVRAARRHSEAQVFTGPIHPRLEGRAPRSCGREGPPVTALDLGSQDSEAVQFAWGTNMTIRRSALERVGPFDATLHEGGDEQEWQERLRAQGEGTIVYVAAAAVHHRRAGADARLRSLARSAHVRGRAARRFDARRGEAPPLARELTTLAACLGHVLLRRCPAGMTMVAHSAGRVREALGERAPARRPAPSPGGLERNGGPRAPREDFLSGESGTIGGVDAVRRRALDALATAAELGTGRRWRLARAARRWPPRRRVLVLSIERPENRELARATRAEIERSRHDVEVHSRAPEGRGKFESLNLLLERHPATGRDWLVVLDDDVALPRGFLDRFLFLAERFELALAQPAHARRSHAAWAVTRRRGGSVVRETSFVEIGPVCAFAERTFPVLLPFPQLRMGWGLDAHWAALARAQGWRCGVVDAVCVRHSAAPAATAYSRADAIAEARGFLAGRPYIRAEEAQRTLTTHRRW